MSGPAEKFSSTHANFPSKAAAQLNGANELASQNNLFDHRSWLTIGILESYAIHRFRNLFMSMMGNVLFVREEIKQGRSPEKYLLELDRSLNDASQYSSWLQTCTEKQKPILSLCDLNEVIQEAIDSINPIASANLVIKFDAPPELEMIQIDPLLVKVCIWEIISEYQKAAVEKVFKQNSTASVIEIEIRKMSKTPQISQFTHEVKQHDFIELKLTAHNLSIPIHQPAPSLSNKSQLLCSNPAIEIAKFVIRLFHGDLNFVKSAENEEMSLFFPLTHS